MLVSVIIPTFNRCGLVREAVASACVQRGTEFEVVIVDDGSTDDTAAALENEFGARVRILRTENRGVAAARNLGVAASRGELIAFLDSDDLWLPGKLAAQTAFFAARPEAEICQTEEIWIRNGVRVNPCAHHRKPSGDIFEPSLRRCLVSPSAVMLRRELFERVGGFDERLLVCEDYDLWLRIARDTPVWLIDRPLVIKRGGHADQLSRRFWGMDRFRVEALTRLLEGELTPAQRQATLSVLTKKCTILAKGAARRGRHAEAEMYRLLPYRFTSTSSFARGSSPGLNGAKPAEAGLASEQPDSETVDFRHGNSSLPLKKGGQEGFGNGSPEQIPLDPPFSKGEVPAIPPARRLSTLSSSGLASLRRGLEPTAVLRDSRD
jgi:glycosyltransferase involved in cell wall biosynthesis